MMVQALMPWCVRRAQWLLVGITRAPTSTTSIATASVSRTTASRSARARPTPTVFSIPYGTAAAAAAARSLWWCCSSLGLTWLALRYAYRDTATIFRSRRRASWAAAPFTTPRTATRTRVVPSMVRWRHIALARSLAQSLRRVSLRVPSVWLWRSCSIFGRGARLAKDLERRHERPLLGALLAREVKRLCCAARSCPLLVSIRPSICLSVVHSRAGKRKLDCSIADNDHYQLLQTTTLFLHLSRGHCVYQDKKAAYRCCCRLTRTAEWPLSGRRRGEEEERRDRARARGLESVLHIQAHASAQAPAAGA